MLFADMNPQPDQPDQPNRAAEMLLDMMLLDIILDVMGDNDVVLVDMGELFANEPVCPHCGRRHPQL